MLDNQSNLKMGWFLTINNIINLKTKFVNHLDDQSRIDPLCYYKYPFDSDRSNINILN